MEDPTILGQTLVTSISASNAVSNGCAYQPVGMEEIEKAAMQEAFGDGSRSAREALRQAAFKEKHEAANIRQLAVNALLRKVRTDDSHGSKLKMQTQPWTLNPEPWCRRSSLRRRRRSC
jgi:hypothetical protein